MPMSEHSRLLAAPFDVLDPLSSVITEAVACDLVLVPAFDFVQNRFQIVGNRLCAFAGVLNSNDIEVQSGE